MLQYIYISIGKGFDVNLFFIHGDFQINDFVKNAQNYLLTSSGEGMGFLALFFSLLVPAALEEIGKFYFFKKIAQKLDLLKSVNICIFAIVYVAIGFAFFETGAYIFFLGNTLSPKELFRLEITRIVVSTLSHIFFSAVIGYYFGKALFLKFELIDSLEISKTTKLIKRLSKIPFINVRSISKVYTIKYLIIGFSLSILLHTVYNFFMSTGNEIFAVFTVIIGIAIFLKIITVKRHNSNYDALKKKIAYLQEMKALKEKMKGG